MKIKCIVLSCLFFITSAGCKKLNPTFTNPLSNITNIRGEITSVAAGDHPYIQLVTLIESRTNGSSIYEPILNFQIGDFAIMENNAPVCLDEITYSREPISAVLVLDRSGSMYDEYDELNAAVNNFIDGLLAIDMVEIIDFGDNVEVTQAFTNDKNVLHDAVNSHNYDMGGTAVWDAVGKGIEEMQKAVSKIKLLIVMTDGADYDSVTYKTVDEVIIYAQSFEQEVHCIGYGSGYSHNDLNALASETGGTFHSTEDAGQLMTIYSSFIPSEVNQTTLHYRTREKGTKTIDVYLNYGIFSEKFTAKYSS